MLKGLDIDLSLPSGRARLQLIDVPEICLIAAIVVAVKHLLPFPIEKGTSSSLQDNNSPHMDWHRWSELMEPVVENLQRKPPAKTPGDVDGERLAHVGEATFDAILALLSPDQGELAEKGRLRCPRHHRHAF